MDNYMDHLLILNETKNNIITKINSIPDLIKGKGCSMEQIKQAEKELGLKFPSEYVEILKEFGWISFGPVEWAGLGSKAKFRNVVYLTNQVRALNKLMPAKSFVLEESGIDAKTVIVDESGKVSLLQPNKISQVCNSISKYLDMCLAISR